jgi:hypothetical protein
VQACGESYRQSGCKSSTRVHPAPPAVHEPLPAFVIFPSRRRRDRDTLPVERSRMTRRTLTVLALGLCSVAVGVHAGQSGAPQRLVFDQAHGQQPPPPPMETLARKLGLEIQTSSGPITAATLDGARILYLRAPSNGFTDDEIAAVVAFVKRGGALFLVLDEERRQKLDATRVNEMIVPFGLKLTPDTDYLHNNGAIAKAGEINKADRELPFSGGRAVEGGTAFGYQLDKDGKPSHPFAAYTQLPGGGRIVVLAEGMATLFLGDPKGVRLSGDRNNLTPYWGKDSAIFMEEVLVWLSRTR